MKINPSIWPINNRTSIYILTILLCVAGYMSYNSIIKEQFPEIKVPTIVVQTVAPGNSPENMENTVTKPLEKYIKNISGIKKMTSNSFQDFSIVTAEFNTSVAVEKAKQDVKDAVDKAKSDPNGLPKNLPQAPAVNDFDFSEFPVLYVNISGNYDLARLKRYADILKDKIEGLKEIKRVDMIGAPEREIQVNVDLPKMQQAKLGFRDIEGAIAYENIEATPGQVVVNGEQRNLSIKKTYKTTDEIANIIVRNPFGATIYLKDIAEVMDTYEEQDSYARLYGKNVITLNIIKAQNKSLIDASDKIQDIIKTAEKTELPSELSVVITGDQSDTTRVTLHDLINTIIIGFLLVVLILMFFMGTTNAFFVALSVPLSCAIAFLVMPMIGFHLNMITLFAFLLALGIVVDDAIVVIENTHRIFHDEDLTITEAAKKATGEVFLPVLTGTITTLMPFIPLAFWSGLIGKFMFFLPITLIITLLASLLVAYIINPVFAVDFMKKDHQHGDAKPKWNKANTVTLLIALMIFMVGHLKGSPALANFSLALLVFTLLNKFVFYKAINFFQERIWPKFLKGYLRLLNWSLKHRLVVVLSTVAIIVGAVVLIANRPPNVVFFPEGEPNFTYVYLNMPEGTDQSKTNEVLKQLETKVYQALEMDPMQKKFNPLVTSVISNVKVAAIDQQSGEVGDFPNKGKITVAYVKFAQRNGKSTQDLLNKIRANVKEIPGAVVTVTKESGGPPTAKPIVIEMYGDNLDNLVLASKGLIQYLGKQNIGGIEELRSDFQSNKPELNMNVNRARMQSEGVSTGQIAGALRTAMFGSEVTRFKDANDDYPVMLRLRKDQRNNVDLLKNMNITYMDMAMRGQIRQLPMSAFVDFDYNNAYGGIKRKNEKRIITVSSNVLGGFNANNVVAEVTRAVQDYKAPTGVEIKLGGEQEEQKETGAFLGKAMGISMIMIFLLLMLQFNSFSRAIIIMSEIVLSIVGIMLGLGIFRNDFSIIMGGIGVVALAGIVVRNGILLIEFFDIKMREGMTVHDSLMEAGRTRMTPVVLTATAAILGLIPLAIGLNMDFEKLLSHGNPEIYLGGDNVAFWGPLSWTMIYGLSFATILTLILVPVLMSLALQFKKWILPYSKMVK
jgi:multidrug efflux pump